MFSNTLWNELRLIKRYGRYTVVQIEYDTIIILRRTDFRGDSCRRQPQSRLEGIGARSFGTMTLAGLSNQEKIGERKTTQE